jgi:hypothetical protein
MFLSCHCIDTLQKCTIVVHFIYHIYKNMRQPYIYSGPPLQFSVFGKSIQNMFKFLCSYKATPNFSDGKKFSIF